MNICIQMDFKWIQKVRNVNFLHNLTFYTAGEKERKSSLWIGCDGATIVAY